MRKFSELSLPAQLGVFLALAVAIVGAGEYFYLQDMVALNAKQQADLDKLKKDNDAIRPFEPKLNQIRVENKQLEVQLANLRTVVPDEKDADAFIRMVQESGAVSGINIRRFTALALVPKEFYMELPFEVEIDGNYGQVVQFFDRLGKLPRIVNISNLAIGPLGAAVRGVRKRYPYTPNETIKASCVATTFFKRPEPPPGAPPPGRPGARR